MTAKSLGSRSGRVPAAAQPEADVTLAEETLKRSEQNLNLAVGRVGTWNWDLATGALEWSSQAKAMFGLPEAAEVTHESFLAMLHPDDREGAVAAIKAALDTEKQRVRVARPECYPYRRPPCPPAAVRRPTRGSACRSSPGSPSACCRSCVLRPAA